MGDRSKIDPETSFSQKVGADAARKIRTKRRGVEGIWLGFGLFGLIGWAVAVPTLLGTFLGAWIDSHFPGVHSWTLSLLIAGLCLGCLNAWHWISQEEKAIRKNEEEKE